MATTLNSHKKNMKLPFLPAPSQPRKYPTVRLAVRAAKLRKWLAFGPSHVTELAAVMRCTPRAIYHTAKVMPDVRIVRGTMERAS